MTLTTLGSSCCYGALWLSAALFALEPAHAASERERLEAGREVIERLNQGQPQPALEAMREEFPFLADATQGYALGEVWSREILDDRTRQLITVGVFAALGQPDYMKIHAGYALNAGVSEEELKEVIYLTTVHAGFPPAIAASAALAELFQERRQRVEDGP
ncbi:carboxymuconolactone decarboxylase family protein [Salinicola corii]|uniref:Carboxymuconolactone decarboxylase family protein n=1 Tax=Salinicola corii TaxID=2606937 RepID=A0A640WE19_9GAMM|nr:carboxymuconolactone decarboxylase family protein [Salinicola corii]KAA0018234.1 carboxymuconolactone decarboxylase family protein [Salinicola corii]